MTKTLSVDRTAPHTTVITSPTGWTNGQVTVTLTASDATSGLVATYYQVGTGPSHTYTAPFTVSAATRITYWSTDVAGNKEGDQQLTPQIDLTKPVTSSADLAADGSSDWQPGPASVTLVRTDSQSGVASTSYQIDSLAPQTYTHAFTITAEGSHKITYSSTDRAGNQEDPQYGWVNIDSVAPTSSDGGLLQSSATSGWRTGPQSVTLSALDASSGMTGGQAAIDYSIDGISQPAYSAAFTVAGEGSHTVSYYAVDAAGNVEKPAHVGYVNIDTTAPVTTSDGLVTAGDTGYVHDAQQVTLSASDLGSGMTGGKAATYYTDTVGGAAATPQAYVGPFTVSGVGSHTITYYSVDALGNTETVKSGYVNIVPDQALVTLVSPRLAADDHSGWLPSASVTVTLTTSGGGGNITTQYSTDGGATWAPYTGPFSVAGQGAHRIDYRSRDDVGDGWSLSSGYANIDTVGPTTNAVGPTTPQRAAATVRFSANDALSGYAATYYNIDGTGAKSGATAIVPALANHKADGVHTITYYSMDLAGNAGPSGKISVTIDTVRPLFDLRGAKSVSVRKGSFLSLRYRSRDVGGACKLVLTFSTKVHKKTVKTTYTVSAKRVTKWQSSKLRLKLAKGAYTVKLQLSDPAGNLSLVKAMHVTVK